RNSSTGRGRLRLRQLLRLALDNGRLTLIPADSRLCDLDSDLLGDLQLHLLLVNLHDLPVDPTGGDHAVVDLQAVEESLYLLLFPLHRQQDDEIEDAEDENERYELQPGTSAIGRCTQRKHGRGR